MRSSVAAVVIALFGAAAAQAQSPAMPPSVTAAVAAPDRPAADTARDPERHPAELLAFAGVRSGDKVADIIPGGGYFTRLFAHIVGPSGHVYAVIPAEMAKMASKMVDGMKALAASPGYGNVSVVVTPTTVMSLPQPLDVAWTSDNYHDLYGFFGADQAAAFDKAVFAALKPGGVFMVVDHAAAPGADGTVAKTLHRIDEETVKSQVEAAGFVLEGESPALKNPADTHQLRIFDPAIKGHTDQFVLKFRKPDH